MYDIYTHISASPNIEMSADHSTLRDSDAILSFNNSVNHISKTYSTDYRLANKVIFISSLFLIFSTELMYRDPLYKFSENLIEQMQKSHTMQDILLYSNISDKIIIYSGLLVVYFAYFVFPIQIAYSIVTSLYYSIFIQEFLKLFYSNLRPFMTNTNIKLYICNEGYGNPSGHALTNAVILGNLVFLLNKYLSQKLSFDSYMLVKPYFNMLIAIICLVLQSIIIYDRLITASHTLNQLLFGSCLGVSVYYYVYYIQMFQNMDNDQFSQSFLNSTANLKNLFLYILLLVVILASFYLDNQYFYRDYLQALIKRECEVKEYKLLDKSLSIFFMTMATNYGLVFAFSSINIRQIDFKFKSLYKYLLFVVLTLLVSNSWLFILFFPDQKFNTISRILIKSILPLTMWAFVLFGIIPFVFLTLHANLPEEISINVLSELDERVQLTEESEL